MASELPNPFLIIHDNSYAIKFAVTLPVTTEEDVLADELRDFAATAGAVGPQDVEVNVDSFDGMTMRGSACFRSALVAERAMAVCEYSAPLSHYVGENVVPGQVTMPDPNAYSFKYELINCIQCSGLDSFVTMGSLFDAFRQFGPIKSLRTVKGLTGAGKQVNAGGIWFVDESSTPAAMQAYNRSSTVLDPCSLTISRHPQSTYPPWHLAYQTGAELEDQLRILFPDAVALDVVDFLDADHPTNPNPRAMGVARFSTPEDAQRFTGDRALDGLGSARIELTSLTRGEKAIKLTVKTPASSGAEEGPPAAPPEQTTTPAVAPDSQPESRLPPTERSPSAPPPEQPLQPVASTSTNPYSSPAPINPYATSSAGPMDAIASGSGSGQASMQAPPKRRRVELSRKAWKSTVEPYAFEKVELRPPREDEPAVPSGYSICDLLKGDLDRMRDYTLSYTGSDWPDFSTMSANKADIQAGRQDRWNKDAERWRVIISAVRAEEVKHTNETFAKKDLPGVGDHLTDQERADIEASLVHLEIGLTRKWHNDDAFLKGLRIRELNSLGLTNPSAPLPSSGSLFSQALLGMDKPPSRPPSATSHSRPPHFAISPAPPPAPLPRTRDHWRHGAPPPPRTFNDFATGTWDDEQDGAFRAEIWDGLNAIKADAGSAKATAFLGKFGDNGFNYNETFCRWHDEVTKDLDYDRWLQKDKPQMEVRMNEGPSARPLASFQGLQNQQGAPQGQWRQEDQQGQGQGHQWREEDMRGVEMGFMG